jgi:hypothetical protein
MRFVAAIALLALVAAGCGGAQRPTVQDAGAAEIVTVKQVQDAFAAKGLPFQREINPSLRGPRLWPVHEDVDAHVLARLSVFDASDTLGGASIVDAWVFDSAESATEALERTPQLGRGKTRVLLHEANVVVVAPRSRVKRVQAALVALRHPGAPGSKPLPSPPMDDD